MRLYATGLRYLPWYPMAGGSGEGDPPATPPPSDPPTSGDNDGQRDERKFSKAELATAVQDALRREREKAAADQKKAADAAEAAKLAEQQQFQALAQKHEQRATELAAELDAREARIAALQLAQAVEREAAALGFTDPTDAHRFLDTSAVTRADDGTPQNVKALLTKVLESKPYLKGQPTGTTGVPATPRAAGAPNREEIVNAKVEALRRTGAYGRF